MGLFTVQIEVSNPESNHSVQLDALANTGTFNTIVPSSTLNALGIEPQETASFELADGSVRDFEVGEVRIQLEGKTTRTPVIFGGENVVPTLGRFALTGMLLDVDAERECLIPVTPRICNHPYPVHPVHPC